MASQKFGPSDFQAKTGVSRETLVKLETYAECLQRWQRHMNLVGKGTINDLWHRHFFDSAQIQRLCQSDRLRLVDLGSGAGFPGLVLSIMGQSNVELVESNGRKCSFLSEVVRATGATAQITNIRLENVSEPDLADVVTSRAVAPLTRLLGYCSNWLKQDGVALLHKGATVEQELTEATKDWTMHIYKHPSQTDPRGVVLEIRELARADGQ